MTGLRRARTAAEGGGPDLLRGGRAYPGSGMPGLWHRGDGAGVWAVTAVAARSAAAGAGRRRDGRVLGGAGGMLASGTARPRGRRQLGPPALRVWVRKGRCRPTRSDGRDGDGFLRPGTERGANAVEGQSAPGFSAHVIRETKNGSRQRLALLMGTPRPLADLGVTAWKGHLKVKHQKELLRAFADTLMR